MRRKNKRRKASSGGEPASQSYLEFVYDDSTLSKKFLWPPSSTRNTKVNPLFSNVSSRCYGTRDRRFSLPAFISDDSTKWFSINHTSRGSRPARFLLRSPIIHGEIRLDGRRSSSFRVSPESSSMKIRAIKVNVLSASTKGAEDTSLREFSDHKSEGKRAQWTPKGISVPIRVPRSFFFAFNKIHFAHDARSSLPSSNQKPRSSREALIRYELGRRPRAVIFPPLPSRWSCQWCSRWWIKVARRFRYLGLREEGKGGGKGREWFGRSS